MHFIIKNLILVTSSKIINNGFIEIKDKKIINFGEFNEQTRYYCEIYDGQKYKVFPGFIDCHTHGGYGIALEDNNPLKYEYFASQLPKEGVTSFLFATVANQIDVLKQNLKNVASFMNNQKGFDKFQSKCLGVHLEGPFIDVAKKGAHKQEYIINPNIVIMQDLINASNNSIKIVSYSLTNDIGYEFGMFLAANEIIGSIGHCNASSQEYKDYAKYCTINHVTHLFNGMSGLENRNSGIALAALNDKEALCELIVDKIHVEEDLVKLAYKCKGSKKICLVTDSISAKGLSDGTYKLGELEVQKYNNYCYLKDTNTLAGSVLCFDKAFKNMKKICNLTDIEMLHITSKNIAMQLGLDKEIGDINYDMKADLVFFDKHYNLMMTMVDGKIVYKK